MTKAGERLIEAAKGIPKPPCSRCGGTGWIPGKDYPDGSSSTERPCPHCRPEHMD